jgi:hypothetical protein
MRRVLLSFPLILSLGACMSGNTIDLEGEIKYKGTIPHNYLAIEDRSHHIYKIANPQEFHIEKLQNHKVKIKAKLLQKARGIGFPALIKLIEIKE